MLLSRRPAHVSTAVEHRYRLQLQLHATGTAGTAAGVLMAGGGEASGGERTMLFYERARVDGLERRVETATAMTEHYAERDDHLVYRHVDFNSAAGALKTFGPADTHAAAAERPILVAKCLSFNYCMC